METASESILLAGKTIGDLTIYPLVQIRLTLVSGSGFFQVLPLAVVVDSSGSVQIFTTKGGGPSQSPLG